MKEQSTTLRLWFTGAIAVACMMVGMVSVAAAVAEAEPTATPATEAQAAQTSGSDAVARSVLTTGIVDREPVDRITGLSNDVTRIYYFTELRDLEGETVVHRWEYDGNVMAEVAFEVGAARWRASSSKNLDPSWLGEWSVSVVDAQGNVLQVDHFLYTPQDS